MSARRVIATSWSRRDRLGMVVIAVTVAFLVGTTLLVLAVGSQTAAIAAEYESPGQVAFYENPNRAVQAADSSSVVLPVAEVQAGGTDRFVIGVPRETTDILPRSLRGPPDDGITSGAITDTRSVTLQGNSETLQVEIQPRTTDHQIPSSWLVTDIETVQTLGSTGAFVLDGEPTVTLDQSSSSLSGALVFFQLATQQTLGVLIGVAVGGGILVFVTVFSITKIAVQNRRQSIYVLRATGASPWKIAGLFGTRGLGITAIGGLVGYAGGVILPNAVINIAIAAGMPTSLSVQVSPQAVAILGPVLGVLVLGGGIVGILAAWPRIRCSPADAGKRHIASGSGPPASGNSTPWTRFRAAFRPRLLGWQVLVPTTATVTGFVTLLVLLSALAGAVAPVTSSSGTTITEPGSPHPIGSQLSTQYADAVTNQDIVASPEILAFQARDEQPYVVRGARYQAFAAVTPETRLLRGHPPRQPRQAVIGADLAQTIQADIGDRITLGGSTQVGFAQVTIVGVYTAPGPYDDQLLVPLSTARPLAGVPEGQAQFIRTSQPLEATESSAPAVSVQSLSTPSPVPANSTFKATITLQNPAPTRQTTTLPIRFDGTMKERNVTVPATKSKAVTVRLESGSVGTKTLQVGNTSQSIDVRPPEAIRIRKLPTEAPPESQPSVQVVTVAGTPATNATLSVGDQTLRTNEQGIARVSLAQPGSYTVQAQHNGYQDTATINVRSGVSRQPVTRLEISPRQPSLFVEPTATVTLENPWNETLRRTLTIEGPGSATEQDVDLRPGENTTLSVTLPRRDPGTYELRVTANATTLDTTSYTVTGDDRLVSALASSGRAGTTGVGQALSVAFGNLSLVFAVLLLLAGLMTVGASTTTFAQAVHTRRKSLGIYRVTGSPPQRILRRVIGDALRISLVATIIAVPLGLGLLQLLSSAGYLTVFGVRLGVRPSPLLLLGVTCGAVCATLSGTVLATLRLLVVSPATLLAGETATEDESHG